MKTIALVQARLGSSRLPLKSLLCLRGHAIIDWVCERVARARLLDGLVVATPDTPLDAVLGAHLARRGVAHFAGPENDVLARFYLAAKAHGATRIVRVCADNPLVWGQAIDDLIRHFDAHDLDYAYNHIPCGNRWPDGLGAEMIRCDTLERLHAEATLPAHREHCLSYIRDNPGLFRMGTFDPANPRLCHPECRLDIDTLDDYRRMALLPISPDMEEDALVRLVEYMPATPE